MPIKSANSKKMDKYIWPYEPEMDIILSSAAEERNMAIKDVDEEYRVIRARKEFIGKDFNTFFWTKVVSFMSKSTISRAVKVRGYWGNEFIYAMERRHEGGLYIKKR